MKVLPVRVLQGRLDDIVLLVRHGVLRQLQWGWGWGWGRRWVLVVGWRGGSVRWWWCWWRGWHRGLKAGAQALRELGRQLRYCTMLPMALRPSQPRPTCTEANNHSPACIA